MVLDCLNSKFPRIERIASYATPMDVLRRSVDDLILLKLKTIIETSSFTHCFFSSMHASNYVPVRGYLPEDKDRMVKQLDAVLSKHDISVAGISQRFMMAIAIENDVG